MMTPALLVSVEEYLATSYRPDCDYVDGRIEERNLGEFDHSRLQTAMAIYFGTRQKEWGITVVVEQRVQVKHPRRESRVLTVMIAISRGERAERTGLALARTIG